MPRSGWKTLETRPLAVFGEQTPEAVAVQRGLDPDEPRHLTKVKQT